ncbi:MAG: RHS repeat-associated core domain-containing protein, partial [Fulvivirga sp.]
MGRFLANPTKLALIQHEEGRIIPDPINGYEYQYHLKDHLGNTRVTFTTKPNTVEFNLNYEEDPNNPDDFDSSVPEENRLFKKVQVAAIKDFNRTSGSGGYDKAQVLRSSPSSQVGSVLAIPVGQGDKITATAYAKYVNAAEDNTITATTLAAALVNAFTTTVTGGIDGGTSTINTNFDNGSLINSSPLFPYEDAAAPKAFLNVMFLPDGDEITLVKDASFAYDQISNGASEAVINGISEDAFDELKIENFVAPANGYVMVYVSNEGSLTDVYFDDISISVEEHPVIQKDDYYPFGLTFNSWQRSATAKENRFKFGGKERQTELDLGWDDFHAKQYDPAIGRMLSVDPLSEYTPNWTPYRFGFNNPIRYSDPSGMSEVDENGNFTYTDPDEIANVLDR